MTTIYRATAENGNDIVLVFVNKGGGRNFYSAELIRVAEIEHGTQYTKINGKNVITDIAEYEYNYFGGIGPNSRYGRLMEKAISVFKEWADLPEDANIHNYEEKKKETGEAQAVYA